MQRIYGLSTLRLGVLFWVMALALYGAAWRSGFERDFHGWFEMFYNQSFREMVNRKGTVITSLYQLTQLQLWGWTWLFGTHLLPWFLLLTGLHAAAAAMVVDFSRKLYADFGWKHASATSFWGGFFFLIAPSHAEVVVWKASYHYPVAVLLCFGIWGLLRQALVTGKKSPIVWAVLFYAFSTFTLELFYTTLPLAVLLLIFYQQQALPGALRRATLGALLPMLVLFAGHFVLYHFLYGNYIPHAEGLVKSALKNPLLSLGRALQYDFHLLLQGRYWPNEWRGKVYLLLGSTAGGIVTLVLFAGGATLLIGRWLRFNQSAPLLWMLAGAFIGMTMIMPIGIIDWGIYYNDRHLYFTGLFQGQLLAVALFALPARARKGALVCMSGVLAGLAFYTALQCRRSATVFWNVLKTFPIKRAREPLILLAMPANLKGIVIFQEGPESQELNSHLRLYTGDSVQAQMHVVAGYGMDVKEDGARVQVKDRKTLEVRITQPGAWFWNGTLGATSGETPLYKMELGEGARQYTLTLKDTTARAFYFSNLQWKEVDFALRDREQE